MKSKRMWPLSSSSRRYAVTSEKEYEVADILLHLPALFSRPSSGIELLLSTPSWPLKRRRSAIDDNKDDDVVVVDKNKPTTTLTLALTPSQSHPDRSLQKSRRKSVSKNQTKEELLKKIDELTQCKEMLTKEVGIVRAYYNKIMAENSTLKATRQRELEKCHIEEGKTKIVTEGLKSNAGTDTPNAGKAMVDPSSWAHPFELEGRIGVC